MRDNRVYDFKRNDSVSKKAGYNLTVWPFSLKSSKKNVRNAQIDIQRVEAPSPTPLRWTVVFFCAGRYGESG